jgi:hypothetical protein
MSKTSRIELNLNETLKETEKEPLTDQELVNWFAFANALKFINAGEEIYNKNINEENIAYKAILTYTQTTSGDIEQYLKFKKGVPMKYSLSTSHCDSLSMEEISYEIFQHVQ